MKYPERTTSSEPIDTNILIQLARTGDCDAFSTLMRRYDRSIRSTAFSIVKNREDAEDVMQDTYLRVFMKLHTFEGTSMFSTWLTRIVINASLMRLRQRRCRPTDSLDELADGNVSAFLSLASLEPDPEQIYFRTDLKIRLHEAVQKLPHSLRGIAEDHIYAELTLQDLANKRGISLAAAKSRAFRARKRLVGSFNLPARGSNTPSSS